MWLLTCSGDLFGGKKVWLRPGSTHLLGRTSGRSENGERIRYIDHKSVSRKHLVIRVGHVAPGDSARLHTRSSITVTDGSKIGTSVNDERLIKDTRTLEGTEFVLKLGSYQHSFHLKWHPVTISFTALGKKAKNSGEDPLKERREALEQADIKLLVDYATNQTTHAVAKKRNTPAGLQALVQGRWLVTDAFVDALTGTAQRSAESTSLLEEDFEGGWPQEGDFLVPAMGEPHPRPDEFLIPDPARAEMFQNITFIFLSRGQYDMLMQVITAGGGKALLWEAEIGRSRPEDLTTFVKEVNGQKNSDPPSLSQRPGKGGEVIVRLNGGEEGWKDFMRAADYELDQRSVEQNEFLDAILSVDASGLIRQLEDSNDSLGPQSTAITIAEQPVEARQETLNQRSKENLAPPSTTHDGQDPVQQNPAEEEKVEPQPAQEQPSVATKRRSQRTATKSRFQGFDDFDPSQVAERHANTPEPVVESCEDIGASSGQGSEVGASSPLRRTQQNPRKRPSPLLEEDEEAMFDNMLTGVAAMKRRKLEAAQTAEQNPSVNSLADLGKDLSGVRSKAKKKGKDIDVMAEVHKRREAENEERRKDEEALQEGLGGIDINDLKNLAQIEEMEVPSRDRLALRSGENGRAALWDPAWNGRKNFKKFRPQGQRRDGPRLQRVIVPLEEVPRGGQGVGDDLWLTQSSERSKSKSLSQSHTLQHSHGRSQLTEDSVGDIHRFQRRIQMSRHEDAERAESERMMAEEIAGHPRDEALDSSAPYGTRFRAQESENLGITAGKRPASQSMHDPAKRVKQTRIAPAITRQTAVSLDDDDDELTFRRRQR